VQPSRHWKKILIGKVKHLKENGRLTVADPGENQFNDRYLAKLYNYQENVLFITWGKTRNNAINKMYFRFETVLKEMVQHIEMHND